MSNSIIDYVFRALGLEYLDRTDIVQVPPAEINNQQITKSVPVKKVEKVETAPVEKVETAPVEKVETAPETKLDTSVDTVQEVLGDMMGDAPACNECGHITIRNGSCYKCLNCGNSLGCS